MFDTTVNVGFYARGSNMLTYFIYDILYLFFTYIFTKCDFLYQIIIGFRFQSSQRYVIQFHLAFCIHTTFRMSSVDIV